MGFLYTAAAFILVVSILVTVHEFGHFWVARRLGVKVLRFSVGFGKPLWSRIGADGTEYVVAAIPLGGYVKMLDEAEAPVDAPDLARAFNRKPLSTRVAVVCAGPLFNFILAILAYWLMFMIGVHGIKPVIDQVLPGGLAERAGMRAGDVILDVDGQHTPTWDSTVVAILDAALSDRETMRVGVTDDNGLPAVRELEIAGLDAELARGRLFADLGIKPLRVSIPPLIEETSVDGPARAAGIQAGDFIVTVDDQPVEDWRDWVEYVRARPGEELRIGLKRDGGLVELRVRAATREQDGQKYGFLGVQVKIPETPESLRAVLQYPPLEALWQSVKKTWQISHMTLRMIGKMLTGQVSFSNISGPITIAQYAGYSATIGLVQFIAFLALVSISLGVLNLLPIPMLDGGHLLYYLIEFIKGGPLSERAQFVGQQIGIVMLALLMSVAVYNDLVRLLR